MLDHDDHTVWTNWFYALPVLPALTLGVLPGLEMLFASLFLVYRSGRYHTTYERDEQGGDVSAMLTYLVTLGSVIASVVFTWALLVPLVAAPLHERYVWEIDSYVATPIYIGACLVILGLVVAPKATVGPGFLAAIGGAIKVSQPGPRSVLHSAWHAFGGAAAGWATGIVAWTLFLGLV